MAEDFIRSIKHIAQSRINGCIAPHEIPPYGGFAHVVILSGAKQNRNPKGKRHRRLDPVGKTSTALRMTACGEKNLRRKDYVTIRTA